MEPKTPWKTSKYTYARIKDVDIEQVKADLTLKFENKVHKKEFPPTIIPLYGITRGRVLVPRFYPTESKLLYKLNPPQEFQFKIKLISSNQQVVFRRLCEDFASPAGRILVLPTGQGKSYITAKLIAHLGRRTLVVCHNKTIANTWRDIIGRGECGFVGGGEMAPKAITVGLIHTLIKQPAKFFDFEFIIFDEVTEYLSEKRIPIFNLAAKPFVLGLTATPDVKKRRIFELYCGDYIYGTQLAGFEEAASAFKVSVQPVYYYGSPEYTQRILSKIGYTSAVEMDKQFARDPDRNALIIKWIMELYAAKKNVFIFTTICEAGIAIKDALVEQYPDVAGDTAVFTGSYKTDNFETINKSKRIVFVSYSFCSVGISIPKMDAIILATPRMAKTEQTVGRIMRLGSDTDIERIVIDIVDMRTTLKSQYAERKKIYRQGKFTIAKPIKVTI